MLLLESPLPRLQPRQRRAAPAVAGAGAAATAKGPPAGGATGSEVGAGDFLRKKLNMGEPVVDTDFMKPGAGARPSTGARVLSFALAAFQARTGWALSHVEQGLARACHRTLQLAAVECRS